MSLKVPRVIDYSKSIIYKLCCKNPLITDIYIGSTTNFKNRKNKHKTNCYNNSEKNKSYNYYIYKFIRDNGGWYNWDMIMIEEYSCENKTQLHTRERYYIELFKSSLNSEIPTRTKQEYTLENIDKVKEYQKQYRLENNNKLKAYHKQYFRKKKKNL